jgi:hypothetical protein
LCRPALLCTAYGSLIAEKCIPRKLARPCGVHDWPAPALTRRRRSVGRSSKVHSGQIAAEFLATLITIILHDVQASPTDNRLLHVPQTRIAAGVGGGASLVGPSSGDGPTFRGILCRRHSLLLIGVCLYAAGVLHTPPGPGSHACQAMAWLDTCQATRHAAAARARPCMYH